MSRSYRIGNVSLQNDLKMILNRILYRNARSFIVEFLKREPGDFALTWMEISKNPALALPSSLLTVRPPDCPHR